MDRGGQFCQWSGWTPHRLVGCHSRARGADIFWVHRHQYPDENVWLPGRHRTRAESSRLHRQHSTVRSQNGDPLVVHRPIRRDRFSRLYHDHYAVASTRNITSRTGWLETVELLIYNKYVDDERAGAYDCPEALVGPRSGHYCGNTALLRPPTRLPSPTAQQLKQLAASL